MDDPISISISAESHSSSEADKDGVEPKKGPLGVQVIIPQLKRLRRQPAEGLRFVG